MTNLSFATEEVYDAFICTPGEFSDKKALAAALRAAADQVVPVPKLPYDSCCDVSASAIRADFLAIAAELEAQQ
jgi:hypothetical protein